jgi:hypothetical protein
VNLLVSLAKYFQSYWIHYGNLINKYVRTEESFGELLRFAKDFISVDLKKIWANFLNGM